MSKIIIDSINIRNQKIELESENLEEFREKIALDLTLKIGINPADIHFTYREI